MLSVENPPKVFESFSITKAVFGPFFKTHLAFPKNGHL